MFRPMGFRYNEMDGLMVAITNMESEEQGEIIENPIVVVKTITPVND